MAAASSARHIVLAQSLPPRLLHFFKRFPPPQLQAASKAQPTTPSLRIAENTSSSNGATTLEATPKDRSTLHWKRNPFLPAQNPNTQGWHGPHYSLRRQASLFKLAVAHNVLPLMPVSPKHPEVKAAKRIEHGLRVKGTGEGQRVKGKHWERTLQQRLEARRKAMESMPDMVNLWRERGHGRGWKRFPRGKGAAAREEVFEAGNRTQWVFERGGSL